MTRTLECRLHCERSARSRAELVEYVMYVRFDGKFADVQQCGYLSVGETLAQKVIDLSLARRKPVPWIVLRRDRTSYRARQVSVSSTS
jgi:hypothetical protein